MKFIYSLIFLLMLSIGSVSARQAYPNGLSGVWWNPQRSGEGILMEQLEGNRVFISWFTYNEDDSGKQMFLTCLGYVNGSDSSCEMYYTSGGKFGDNFSPSLVRQHKWGDIQINQSSCNTIKLWYFSTETGENGDIELERPLNSAVDNCQPHVAYETNLNFFKLNGFILGNPRGTPNQCFDTVFDMADSEVFYYHETQTLKVSNFFAGECELSIAQRNIDGVQLNVTGNFVCSKPINTGTFTATIVSYMGTNNISNNIRDYEMWFHLTGPRCNSDIAFKGFSR